MLGSAGSNRIRSAILQTIIRVIDDGMPADEAVRGAAAALRGRDRLRRAGNRHEALEAAGRTISRFRDRNLFFGGVQAVERDAGGGFCGGGDPRRGGAAIVVQSADEGSSSIAARPLRSAVVIVRLRL